jgi:hypothetical protein
MFACADRNYEDFAPIFIASCLWSNPGVSVEIGVEDVDQFMSVHGATVAPIRDHFGPNSFLIRKGEFWRPNGAPIMPHSVRFLTTPLVVTDYVYIGDIDIVVLGGNILGRHLRNMARTGLPFSNSMRKGSKKLTGLHFTRYDALYPLPDDSYDIKKNDETLLTILVRRKAGDFSPNLRGCSLHGIHVSPNRPPRSEFHSTERNRTTVRLKGWDWNADAYIPRWKQFRISEMFKEMEPHLSERLAKTVTQLDEFEPLRLGSHKRTAETVTQIDEVESADWL